MPSPNHDTLAGIHQAADLIRAAQHVVVLTGAGSSTPSGVPDFRSPGSGLWNRFSPMKSATLTAFRRNPEEFYDFVRPLVSLIHQAHPNPAHLALAELEKRQFIQSIITQNIDGLHQRAGSRVVIEVHGTLNSLTCLGCYQQYSSTGFLELFIEQGDIPRCPSCNNILKPDVILFEEQLPYEAWIMATQETKACDAMIIAGSSLEVFPVADLPWKAYQNQAAIIVINKTPTYIDPYAQVILNGDVADIIPQIVEELHHAQAPG